MTVKKITKFLLVILLYSLMLSACGGGGQDEAATARPEQVNSAQTAFAQPTNTPRPRATVTPLPDIETELARTTARMARAVLDQDEEAYFNQVWPNDPVFLQEQKNWSIFWLNEEMENFTLSLSLIETISDTEARARMTVIWKRGEEIDNQAGGATLTVRFLKEDAASDTWLFAGEAWETVSLYWNGANWIDVWDDDTPPADGEERLRVYYLPDHGPIEGTRDAAELMIEDLPGAYNVVLNELDHEPTQITHVRLYDLSDNLRYMASLELTPLTFYRNNPNEAVRFAIGTISKLPPDVATQVVGLTEAVIYQMAGNVNDTYPSWVVSATNQLIIGRNYQTQTWINNNIEFTLSLLPNTEAIEPEDSPLLQEFINPVAMHIFMVYLDETYGEAQRTTWLKAIITGTDLETATQDVYEMNFADMSAAWMIWLSEQL